MAIRFDLADLGEGTLTPEGYLVVKARPTRLGVLEYKRQDGTSIRELHHEDDLFSEPSLSTLLGQPVTVGHTAGMVDVSKVRSARVGQVFGMPSPSGDFVEATLRIEDPEVISRIQAGDLVELSAGYTCDIDPTPGEWRGEKYDARQVGMRYNHVALLPSGKGRAGSECRIRLDSAGDAFLEDDATMTVKRNDEESIAVDPQKVMADRLALLEKELGEAQAKIAELQSQIAQNEQEDLAEDASDLLGEEVSVPSPDKDGDGDVDSKDAEKSDKPDFVKDSMDSIRKRVIGKFLPEVKLDGLDTPALVGLYEASRVLAKRPAPVVVEVEKTALKGLVGLKRTDSNDVDLKAAREEMIANRRKMAFKDSK